jgi:diguanylate cyclase (GGDEF)-like protein
LPTSSRVRAGPPIVVPHHIRNPRAGIALLVLSLIAAVSVAGEYLTGGHARLWFANSGWTVSALVAVLGVGTAWHRSAGTDRPGWTLLLAGCVAWLIGQLFWNAYGVTSYPQSPNPADICWLAFGLAAAAGVHRLCRGPTRSRAVPLLEVTPLIVAAGALIVALLADSIHASRLSGLGQATALAYPILSVSAVLVMMQALLAGGLDLRKNRGIVVVLAGLALEATGLTLWSPQLLTATYAVGADALDALWSVGLILIGVGAWASAPAVTRPQAEPVSRRWDGALPALTFVILAGVHTVSSTNGGGADLALSIGLWIMGMTLIAHATILRRHQAALFTQLHAREQELSEANTLLRQQSRTDPLTGLANRLRLREDLADLEAQHKRYGHGYCLVLIDLDRFKQYNDDHGHLAGDLVLARIADMLNRTMRATDRAYRYGGEELLLVLRGQDLNAGFMLAERNRGELHSQALPHSLNTPHGVVTLSAGVATAQPGETPKQVLHRADQALYEAKAMGRNHTAVATPATAPGNPAAALTPSWSSRPGSAEGDGAGRDVPVTGGERERVAPGNQPPANVEH